MTANSNICWKLGVGVESGSFYKFFTKLSYLLVWSNSRVLTAGLSDLAVLQNFYRRSMKTLESAKNYLVGIKAPTSTLEIASRLLEQAEMTHSIGMAILEQAEGFEGQKQSKRRDDGLKMLRASKAAFMEAARLIAPFEELDRQKALIDYAIESGYQLAYEIGKKIHFERTDCLGNRHPVLIESEN